MLLRDTDSILFVSSVSVTMIGADCHALQISHRFGTLVQKSGKEPTADSFVNPTHTACSAAIVESGASTGMAPKDATQSAPSPHPAMLAEDPAAPSKQARMRAKKTKVFPATMLCCIMTNHRCTNASSI